VCGGVFDHNGPPEIDLSRVEPLPGIWKYRHTFDLDPGSPIVSLGEGNTPLIEDRTWKGDVFYKLESLNPTGSYKDRATAVLATVLVQRGIREAVEDSSGNAGASFAGYAARAGIHARIFVPAAASGPKRRQIEMFGADLVPVDGPRSAAAEAVRREAEVGCSYASHAFLPFGTPGIATMAYEIFDQLHGVPGTIIAPVGHGSLLLGIVRGFMGLQQAGLIQTIPALVGVQVSACPPVYLQFATGEIPGEIPENATLAEGVRVRNPVRAEALLNVIRQHHGSIVAVEEEWILPGRDALARRGLYVEPTSAIVWNALEQVRTVFPSPYVLVLSGSGFKYQPAA
jgi:threonine synthase